MRFCVLLIIVLTAFLFTACGEEKKESASCDCVDEKAAIIEQVGKDITTHCVLKMESGQVNESEFIAFGGGSSAGYSFTINEEKDGCCEIKTFGANEIAVQQNNCGEYIPLEK